MNKQTDELFKLILSASEYLDAQGIDKGQAELVVSQGVFDMLKAASIERGRPAILPTHSMCGIPVVVEEGRADADLEIRPRKVPE